MKAVQPFLRSTAAARLDQFESALLVTVLGCQHQAVLISSSPRCPGSRQRPPPPRSVPERTARDRSGQANISAVQPSSSTVVNGRARLDQCPSALLVTVLACEHERRCISPLLASIHVGNFPLDQCPSALLVTVLQLLPSASGGPAPGLQSWNCASRLASVASTPRSVPERTARDRSGSANIRRSV